MSRDEIIQHATTLFLQHGYKTITMDEIASELGISKKTLYEHIGNKGNLIKASVGFQLAEFRQMSDKILEQNLDAIDEITTIISQTRNKVSNPQHNTALYQLQKYYPKIYKSIYASQLNFIKDLLRLNLLKGQAQGLYRADLNADYFSEVVFITQNSLKGSEGNLQNLDKVNCMTDMHFDLIMRGILTTEGLTKYEESEIFSK